MNVTHVARWVLLSGLIVLVVTGVACDVPPPSSRIAEPGLHGAGATFPAPLYAKWIEAYAKEHPDVTISYDAVGSGDGIKMFIDETVDFGASDAAMTDEEIAQVERGVQLIPMTAGSIVLAYNIDGVADLKLSRDVIADIFLGKITNWSDPRIQEINPGQTLPRATISVVVRKDASGTTYAFTNHLSAISTDWKEGPGTGKLVGWPGGAMQARGNEGVAGRIARSVNSIGYVEFGTAQRAGLAMAWLENKAGHYVQPDDTTGRKTLAAITLPDDPADLRVFMPDPDGEQSYPIVTMSWLLLYRDYDDAEKAEQLRDWIEWCLDQGQGFSSELGYIPLPANIVSASKWALANIK